MTRDRIDPAAFIAARLPATPVPGVPEIRLRKANPASGLGRLAEATGGETGAPYWAFFWAGGLALARHILDHPGIVAGRRVLDAGAGSGLVAIAAAKAGAREVLAVDLDPMALVALRLNAELNGVPIATILADVAAFDPGGLDIVLAGDLFYSAEVAARAGGFLERARRAGARVLVGDPRRPELPLARLREIARHEVAEADDGRPRACGVFEFTG